MRADRRVDAAWPVQLAEFDRADDLLVERLAHAVQTLEFILPRRVRRRLRHLVNCRQRVRVVRRELRVHRIGCCEQPPCARQVRDVGVGLAREHRIAFEPFDLGALDLAVPVGALHQPNHQPMTAATRQINDEIDDERASLLVRLNDETDAVPLRERGLEAQLLHQVERQLQTVGFFGVDVQADVVLPCQQREVAQHRIQLVHHAGMLCSHIARMQRRQLDRNARPLVDAAAGRCFADRMDRLLVGNAVTLGIVRRQRGLAEHVVRITKAFGLQMLCVVERLRDGFASHELLAHHAHRHVDALADQRLAAFADQPRQRVRKARFAVGGNQFSGHQQTPCCRIDEHRRAAAGMRLPLAVCDLVADQRIAGRGVRDAQQRFGKAHQRDTFLRRQRVLLEQTLHHAGTAGRVFSVTQLRGDAVGQRVCRSRCIATDSCCLQKRQKRFSLRLAVGRGDLRTQWRRSV